MYNSTALTFCRSDSPRKIAQAAEKKKLVLVTAAAAKTSTRLYLVILLTLISAECVCVADLVAALTEHLTILHTIYAFSFFWCAMALRCCVAAAGLYNYNTLMLRFSFFWCRTVYIYIYARNRDSCREKERRLATFALLRRSANYYCCCVFRFALFRRNTTSFSTTFALCDRHYTRVFSFKLY